MFFKMKVGIPRCLNVWHMQMWMSVLWITEVAVHTLTVPTHLENTTVPVLEGILVMDSTAQVRAYAKYCYNQPLFAADFWKTGRYNVAHIFDI